MKVERVGWQGLRVGDRVLIAQYGGNEVKIDDVKYKLVREDDILGVIS